MLTFLTAVSRPPLPVGSVASEVAMTAPSRAFARHGADARFGGRAQTKHGIPIDPRKCDFR